MNIWQHWKVFGLEDWARDALRQLPAEKQPAKCTACKACEEECPNQLEVCERFKELGPLLQGRFACHQCLP